MTRLVACNAYTFLLLGLFEIHRELQPLELIVASVCQLIQFDAEAKHLTLTYTISADVPALMTFDERRFRQILFNLLSNAMNFAHFSIRHQAHCGLKFRTRELALHPTNKSESLSRLFSMTARQHANMAVLA
ncbi:MAG: hypothetical protein ACOVSW_10810 [Candidatus Kapaibacteriota bacterium]